MKYIKIAVAIASLGISLIGCSNKNTAKKNKTYILARWMQDSDTILYFEDSRKLSNIIKLENGERGGLLCGYTYEIYQTDSSGCANWVASANKDCKTIADKEFTYFKMDSSIQMLEDLSKKGIRRYDSASNENNLNSKISKMSLDSKFIGYSRHYQKRLYSVVSDNSKEEIENYIKNTENEEPIISLRTPDFEYCSDKKLEGQLCGILDQEYIDKIEAHGLKIKKTILDIQYITYWKI